MKISLAEVEHIADLARLELTNVEKRRFAEQLSEILNDFEKLSAVDTHAISPTDRVVNTELPLRADRARLGLTQEAVLKNAAETEDSQFRVPPVFGD